MLEDTKTDNAELKESTDALIARLDAHKVRELGSVGAALCHGEWLRRSRCVQANRCCTLPADFF
jgi:hypothetical protein